VWQGGGIVWVYTWVEMESGRERACGTCDGLRVITGTIVKMRVWKQARRNARSGHAEAGVLRGHLLWKGTAEFRIRM
jgi:hypothetical protein